MKPFRLAIPAAVAALAAGCTSYDPQPLGELRLDAYAPSAGDAEVPAPIALGVDSRSGTLFDAEAVYSDYVNWAIALAARPGRSCHIGGLS